MKKVHLIIAWIGSCILTFGMGHIIAKPETIDSLGFFCMIFGAAPVCVALGKSISDDGYEHSKSEPHKG